MYQISDEYLYKQRLIEERKGQKVIKKKLKESGFFKALKKVDKAEVTSLSRFIIVVAIIGDIFGLVIGVGNFLAVVFTIILIILYIIDGLGRGFVSRKYKKVVRTWILRVIIYLIEIIFPMFSWLPLFTIEALIHYYLTKKGYYKKIQKATEIINKLK